MDAPDEHAVAAPPPLPRGYRAEAILSSDSAGWVLRASREVGSARETVVLRIDGGSGDTDSELSVLASVDHPGIARLADHGPLPGAGRFVVRPWIQGVDLLQWARSHSPEECGVLVARLTPALDHLHRQGFVHADLKPENVIVRDDGVPILVDFGLARPWRRGQDETDPGGSAQGTLFSIAPEILLGLAASPSSDLFAVGAMLHRLLASPKRSARDFYASFPRASFLDAMGTDPEELPSWSRDLVVQLTARAPHRRPRSAGAVGRALAERLGIELETDLATEAPRWPVFTGRDPWLAATFRRIEASLDAPLWIHSPAGEDPVPIARHLRIYAALRGRRSRGLDLAAELAGVTDGVALDEWAAAVAGGLGGERYLLVRSLDAWKERALQALVRATEVVKARGGERPGLVVISACEAPDDSWQESLTPPIEPESVRRFIAQHFPREDEGRRTQLADRLFEACGGSATRVDGVLSRAAERGWFVFDDDTFRLRPGDVPDLAKLLAEDAPLEGVAGLGPSERAVLDALDLCGEDSAPDEVTRIAGRITESATGAFLALCRTGWIRVDRGRSGTSVSRLRTWPGALGGLDGLRRMHGARALELTGIAGREGSAEVHRFCATPDRKSALQLADRLRDLRDSGRAEVALALVDRLDVFADSLGIRLEQVAPEILVERGHSWASLGRTELALAAVAPLEPNSSERVASGVALVQAKVDALRHRTDQALESYERAAALHPGAVPDATVGRIGLLHSLGRDQEVSEAVSAFAPAEREQRGELTARWRMYLESLAAMSEHRLGRVKQALETTRELAREAHLARDVGLEAALRINLSLMERASGSLLRGRSELEQSLWLYDQAGLVAGLAHARGELGGLLRQLGELVEAEEYLVRGMETRHRLDDREGATTLRGMLGLLLFERGHARAAIETLESTAADMTGAQQRRFAPLLTTLAIEMRARLGDESRLGELPAESEESDPRILCSKARIAWKRGQLEQARAFFERAVAMSESLKMGRLVQEARTGLRRMLGEGPMPEEPSGEGLQALDARVLHLLDPPHFDPELAMRLADELERRGRDDRAVRVLYALTARTDDQELGRALTERVEALFSRCAAGLTAEEAHSLRMHLLNEPDPWPGDLALRSFASETQDPSDDVLLLLELNRQLTREENLGGLLGAIVDHALRVTGAERGFLVLEEHGELRFDTALDSCKGDVEQPEFEVSASIIQTALESMSPIRVSNAVDDPLMGHRTSVMSLELRSILCVPFEITAHLRGAIYVDHRLRKGAFGERAERLCSLLADQAAVAILQLRRLQEIRSLNRELERRVVDREADLSKARRALEKAGGVQPLEELLGESSAMHEVRALLARAGPAELPVLITGASGTGKELAARALHDLSPRVKGRFVSESCAALPASLMESELFGFRRGAFTGADRDHVGLIEQAHGGTLFLDEIGEMPLDLQAKLLRALETGRIRRLGENDVREVDFRVVSATNRDLELEVREKRFRADLFYRIEGLRVRMPELADRREDIPLMAQHFLERESGPRSGRRLSKKVLTALARRAWPGNVRELRNEVARLCVLCDGDLDDPSLISAPASTNRETSSQGVLPLAELERRAILNALEATGGDKRRAAELLGISRAKIYQRIKEWQSNEKA